jgi:hypothetical protein
MRQWKNFCGVSEGNRSLSRAVEGSKDVDEQRDESNMRRIALRNKGTTNDCRVSISVLDRAIEQK